MDFAGIAAILFAATRRSSPVKSTFEGAAVGFVFTEIGSRLSGVGEHTLQLPEGPVA